MSSIIRKDRYFARHRPNRRNESTFNHQASSNERGDKRKALSQSYRVDGYKLYAAEYKNLKDIEFSSGTIGEQIITSSKSNTVYTGWSNNTGFRQVGLFNCYENMPSAVEGNVLRSVNCHGGPFRKGFILDADIAEFVIVSGEMGITSILDCNLHPVKKLQTTDYGPANDMALNFDKSTLVSVNNDTSLATIDVKSFTLVKKLHAASGYPFSGVDFAPEQRSVFITCCAGMDSGSNFLIQWDTRKAKPGTILSALTHPASCLKWSQQNPNLVYVCTLSGYVHFIDVRNPSSEGGCQKLDSKESIIKIKTLCEGKKIIALNNTNKVIKIDEKTFELEFIETGLPEDFIIRDIIDYKSEYFVTGSDLPNIHTIDIKI